MSQNDHGHGHASDGSHVEEVAQVNEPENGHAEGAHGHAPGAIAVTLWTEQTEFFMEYPALVIGEEAEFLAHLTDLRDFSPVTQGKLVCTFQQAGGTEVRGYSGTTEWPRYLYPCRRLFGAGYLRHGTASGRTSSRRPDPCHRRAGVRLCGRGAA